LLFHKPLDANAAVSSAHPLFGAGDWGFRGPVNLAESVNKILPAGERVVENLPRHVSRDLEKGGARTVCPDSESGLVPRLGGAL